MIMSEFAVQEMALVITGLRIEAGDPEIDASYPSMQAAVRRHVNELGVLLRDALEDD
jgi:hypothetical protein